MVHFRRNYLLIEIESFFPRNIFSRNCHGLPQLHMFIYYILCTSTCLEELLPKLGFVLLVSDVQIQLQECENVRQRMIFLKEKF